MPVLISACLLGVNCRYDGCSKPAPQLLAQLEGKCLIPICPEQLGGLSTPRPPAEIEAGDGKDVLTGRSRVLNDQGQDVTENYLRGAREVVKLAKLFSVKRTFFKELSPACGVKYIKRRGKRLRGMGVTAAALAEAGIELVGI